MSDTRTLPRVLLLTQNKIQPFSGGGIVLSTLFRHFPADHLMIFHRDQPYASQSRCEEHRMIWSWLRLDLRLLCGQLFRWLTETLRRPSQSRLRDLTALVPASSYFKFPRHIERRVGDFRPDIIYAWAADSLWSRTVEEVARRYRLPYVIHFMDNQFEAVPVTNLQRALAPAFRDNLTRIVRGASEFFTISEAMGEAYRRHWDRPYEVYRGTIDVGAWPWPNATPPVNDGVFRVGFAGSVDRSQLQGLRNVAVALDALTAQGRPAKLVLYLTDYYARMVAPAMAGLKVVEIREHPSSAELRERFGSMDALVLAYAFDDDSIHYYRYSFATKSVAYMLSGRPILVHGPLTIEPVNYCARGGWAMVVSEPSTTAVAQAVEKLMSAPELRDGLARAAWDAGCREHDCERHAARFATSLTRLARSSS